MQATESRNVAPLRASEALRIACVTRTADGAALSVKVDGVEWSVTAHLDTVPTLAAGDAVLVEQGDDGVIVLGRLRGPAEPPAAVVRRDAAGRLLLDNPEGVLIRCGDSTLELREDGAILLDGRTIQACAEGLHRLQGATIELN